MKTLVESILSSNGVGIPEGAMPIRQVIDYILNVLKDDYGMEPIKNTFETGYSGGCVGSLTYKTIDFKKFFNDHLDKIEQILGTACKSYDTDDQVMFYFNKPGCKSCVICLNRFPEDIKIGVSLDKKRAEKKLYNYIMDYMKEMF